MPLTTIPVGRETRLAAERRDSQRAPCGFCTPGMRQYALRAGPPLPTPVAGEKARPELSGLSTSLSGAAPRNWQTNLLLELPPMHAK